MPKNYVLHQELNFETTFMDSTGTVTDNFSDPALCQGF